jgi:cytochrome c peroxidase
VLCSLPLLLAVSVASAADLSAFHRKALLARFDGDKNGTLDEAEKRELRTAFGGIDVPMLPGTLFDYATVRLPAHVDRAEFRQADNTPPDNAITNAGAALGRVLFYDKQLSRNNSTACASCHLQRAGFADPRRFSAGFNGGFTGRNATGLASLRYTNLRGHHPGFFWDERAATLEAQVLMPIQDKLEMGMKLPELDRRLSKLPYYPVLFDAAFGSPKVTSDRIAKSVAQFMRSMVSMNTKFDRAAPADGGYSANFKSFSDEENHGKSLFIDGIDGIAELGCAHCHIPPTFGMTMALNNGLALKYKDRGLGALNRPSNDPFTPSNDGKFKAPSLRNIELTAPYMHDGRFITLKDVIEHYSSGVHSHANVGLAFDEQNPSKKTSGFRFTAGQKTALIAFLKTLTDRQFVTDPRFSDPFVRSPAKSRE